MLREKCLKILEKCGQFTMWIPHAGVSVVTAQDVCNVLFGIERQKICYKGFKRVEHVRELMNIQGPGHKPKTIHHKCNVCNKAFQKPSQVGRHMRIHKGERRFTCQICKHSREKPHICSYCSPSFVQNSNLPQDSYQESSLHGHVQHHNPEPISTP